MCPALILGIFIAVQEKVEQFRVALLSMSDIKKIFGKKFFF